MRATKDTLSFYHHTVMIRVDDTYGCAVLRLCIMKAVKSLLLSTRQKIQYRYQVSQHITVVPRQARPTDNWTPRITAPGFSGTAPR